MEVDQWINNPSDNRGWVVRGYWSIGQQLHGSSTARCTIFSESPFSHCNSTTPPARGEILLMIVFVVVCCVGIMMQSRDILLGKTFTCADDHITTQGMTGNARMAHGKITEETRNNLSRNIHLHHRLRVHYYKLEAIRHTWKNVF